MLAADYRGPRRMRVASKADPVIQHPRDAIVRVTRSCICGSDLHLYNGLVPDTRIGTTFGHEFCGIVEEVGPEVQTLKAGDHVLVPFNIACGQIDIGNALTDMAVAMTKGVPQADGTTRVEPVMDAQVVADTVLHMASLPEGANIQFVTVMATKMPFIGRG